MTPMIPRFTSPSFRLACGSDLGNKITLRAHPGSGEHLHRVSPDLGATGTLSSTDVMDFWCEAGAVRRH
jgi:hypothetical protein